MNNDIKALQKLINHAKASVDNDDMEFLAREMSQIKSMLINVILMMQSEQIRKLMHTPENKDFKIDNLFNKLQEPKSTPPPTDRKQALDNLAEIVTTNKHVDGSRTFILHRNTKDFEYQKSADKNNYETTEPTEWIAEVEKAEADQTNKNPVVSCYIPEAAIITVEGQDHTGIYDMGKNPHSFKYKIKVKPGKYDIYRELKN